MSSPRLQDLLRNRHDRSCWRVHWVADVKRDDGSPASVVVACRDGGRSDVPLGARRTLTHHDYDRDYEFVPGLREASPRAGDLLEHFDGTFWTVEKVFDDNPFHAAGLLYPLDVRLSCVHADTSRDLDFVYKRVRVDLREEPYSLSHRVGQ